MPRASRAIDRRRPGTETGGAATVGPSARLFYERAARAGDGRAALRLGATFDPAFLSRLGIAKGQADPAAARLWYGRALDLGVSDAKRQLNNLEAKPGR